MQLDVLLEVPFLDVLDVGCAIEEFVNCDGFV